MSRRAFDFYPTPAWATEALLERVRVRGIVLEPCAGDGAIADVIPRYVGPGVVTNDIDPTRGANHSLDATQIALWAIAHPDWTISNPPFSVAFQIVKWARLYSNHGVAMLLRLSFLEPTHERGGFLADFPPSRVIVLPRISFTGDGKTDSVTCAWMVWQFPAAQQRQIIEIVPKPTRKPVNASVGDAA